MFIDASYKENGSFFWKIIEVFLDGKKERCYNS